MKCETPASQFILRACLGAVLALPTMVVADNNPSKAPADAVPAAAKTPSTQDQAPVDLDNVPIVGAAVDKPHNTIGAGARGGESNELSPEVFLLAPKQTGATSLEQPTFYWYLSRETDFDVEFVIYEPNGDRASSARPPAHDPSGRKPLFRKVYEGTTKAGLHQVDLSIEEDSQSHSKISLKPGVEYQITVLACTHENASKDPFSMGFVVRLAPPSRLGGNPDGMAYAASGFCYDALDSMERQWQKSPADPKIRRQLCGLIWGHHMFFAVQPDADLNVGNPRGAAMAEAAAKEKENGFMIKFNQLLIGGKP